MHTSSSSPAITSFKLIPESIRSIFSFSDNFPPSRSELLRARVVRGRFISLRSEEFVIAARLDGNSRKRMIFRHMLPSFTSHLIASLTLSIPGMILAETALSFLGLGLMPPIVSWGVLLQDAQNIRTVSTAPWLLLPAVAVVLAVLSLNFVGDGLRDAADPYKQ